MPAKEQIILALGTSKYHQNRFYRTPKYHLEGPRSPTIGAPKYHHKVSRSTTITVVWGSRTTTVEAYLRVPKYHYRQLPFSRKFGVRRRGGTPPYKARALSALTFF